MSDDLTATEDGLLLNALVKLTEATALLKEIYRRREAAHLDPFLDQKIEDSDLAYTTRIINAVELHNKFLEDSNEGLFSVGGKYLDKKIETVRDFIALSAADLLRVPNVGRRSVDEVIAVLSAHGVSLARYRWWKEVEAENEVA